MGRWSDGDSWADSPGSWSDTGSWGDSGGGDSGSGSSGVSSGGSSTPVVPEDDPNIRTYTDSDGNVHVQTDPTGQFNVGEGSQMSDRVVAGFRGGYSGSGFRRTAIPILRQRTVQADILATANKSERIRENLLNAGIIREVPRDSPGHVEAPQVVPEQVQDNFPGNKRDPELKEKLMSDPRAMLKFVDDKTKQRDATQESTTPSIVEMRGQHDLEVSKQNTRQTKPQEGVEWREYISDTPMPEKTTREKIDEAVLMANAHIHDTGVFMSSAELEVAKKINRGRVDQRDAERSAALMQHNKRFQKLKEDGDMFAIAEYIASGLPTEAAIMYAGGVVFKGGTMAVRGGLRAGSRLPAVGSTAAWLERAVEPATMVAMAGVATNEILLKPTTAEEQIAKGIMLAGGLPFAVAGWKGGGQVTSRLQTIGRTEIPAPISDVVLSGKTTFPEIQPGTKPHQLLAEFKSPEGTSKAYHATGEAKGDAFTIGFPTYKSGAFKPGHKGDVPGLYVSPEGAGTSPFFLRVNPEYGSGLKEVLRGFTQSEPFSPTVMHIEMAGVKRMPPGIRQNLGEAVDFLKPGELGGKASKDTAYLTTAIENTMASRGAKFEAEAVITPGTVLKRTGKGQFFTYEGRRIPVDTYKTSGIASKPSLEPADTLPGGEPPLYERPYVITPAAPVVVEPTSTESSLKPKEKKPTEKEKLTQFEKDMMGVRNEGTKGVRFRGGIVNALKARERPQLESMVERTFNKWPDVPARSKIELTGSKIPYIPRSGGFGGGMSGQGQFAKDLSVITQKPSGNYYNFMTKRIGGGTSERETENTRKGGYPRQTYYKPGGYPRQGNNPKPGISSQPEEPGTPPYRTGGYPRRAPYPRDPYTPQGYGGRGVGYPPQKQTDINKELKGLQGGGKDFFHFKRTNEILEDPFKGWKEENKKVTKRQTKGKASTKKKKKKKSFRG